MSDATVRAGPGGSPEWGPLLEREVELAEIERLLDRACSGEGERVVVEGPAGAGKTRLLESAADAARARGVRVLEASAAELEVEIGYGVARSLLGDALANTSPARRRALLTGAASLAAPAVWPEKTSTVSPRDPAAVLHGLFWLVSNLAEQGCLLLVVDDVHWADGPSLRFLAYLAHRLSGLPVLLLIATRPGEASQQADLVSALTSERFGARLRPAPLSEAAVGRLASGRFGPDVAPEFIGACHAATGGNPYLVNELLTALLNDRVAPTADHAALVERVGPEAVSRAVLARVSRAGGDARSLIDAVAVLGGRCELRHAAALAGIGPEAAARASDRLARLGVLRPARPIQFVHPLVHAAIYEAMLPGHRSSMHRAAAGLLATDGASPELPAVHLLNTEPLADQWVVAVLRSAAAAASAKGAPGQAAAYLRRALGEPPGPGARGPLLHDLGAAELLARNPAATDHLAQALAATEDPAARSEIALLLGRAAVSMGRLTEARELLGPVIEHLGETQLPVVARLEAYRSVAGVWDPRFAAELEADLPRLRALAERTDTSGRSLLLLIAFRAAFDGGDHEEILALVARGLDDGRLLESESAEAIELTWATRALTFIDELDLADGLIDGMVADSRRRGSIMGYATSSAWRAAVALGRGRIGPAEADARTAVDLATTHGLHFIAPHAHSFLGEALIELGELQQAATMLEGAKLGPMLGTRPEVRFLHTRARARLARGERDPAIEDLRACQAQEAFGFRNPNVVAWRSTLALALPDRSHEEALALVETELDLASRIGQPRAVGVALRARGLLRKGDEQISLLMQAASVLAESPSRLEHARALTDLGASLRRASRRTEARSFLREGLDLAAACGAVTLAVRAHEELVAAGARPRRERVSGVEALTTSELRVAHMAASGMSNREIAQELFVTSKTVALHLTHVYEKLDINGRAQLPRELGEITTLTPSA
jgi:DNA-binding CsgD family transcriptional regulator/tetratricopeptide (TPR) repeat protein